MHRPGRWVLTGHSIFALQRCSGEQTRANRNTSAPTRSDNAANRLPDDVAKELKKHYDTVLKGYGGIADDVQGLNGFRYSRSLTGGNQELMEALAFQYYLEHGQVMPLDAARRRFDSFGGDGGQAIPLSDMDYLLGVFDMTGELMRYAITAMAIGGAKEEGGPGGSSVLVDLQELGRHLDGFRVEHDSHMQKQVRDKAEVMLRSIEKVEKACYGLVVRGSERRPSLEEMLVDGA
jgi:predicted translin family RNA/ssDNA-binding protein